MFKRIIAFIGWGLSSLFFLIGIVSLPTQPLTGMGIALWGLIVFPPLYKAQLDLVKAGILQQG
jgi:hypothetical protein